MTSSRARALGLLLAASVVSDRTPGGVEAFSSFSPFSSSSSRFRTPVLLRLGDSSSDGGGSSNPREAPGEAFDDAPRSFFERAVRAFSFSETEGVENDGVEIEFDETIVADTESRRRGEASSVEIEEEVDRIVADTENLLAEIDPFPSSPKDLGRAVRSLGEGAVPLAMRVAREAAEGLREIVGKKAEETRNELRVDLTTEAGKLKKAKREGEVSGAVGGLHDALAGTAARGTVASKALREALKAADEKTKKIMDGRMGKPAMLLPSNSAEVAERR